MPVAQGQVLLWDALAVPFFAIVGLGLVDSRYGRRGLGEWFVHLGWDSCVLAAGAAPAIFSSPNSARFFGSHFVANRAVYGFEFVVVLIAGFFLSWLKGSEKKTETDALLALVVGGALLGFLAYIV